MSAVLSGEVWVEPSLDTGIESILLVAEGAPREFWTRLSVPGEPVCIGWVRWTWVAQVKGRPIYAATQLRPADGQDPPSPVLSLLPSALLQGAGEDGR